MEIQTIVAEFTERVIATIEAQTMDRVRRAVIAAFDQNGQSSRPGPTPKALAAPSEVVSVRARRKPPRQFCPVPACKNTAAPIFGMVCAEHKNISKVKIRKYRAARHAAKIAA